LGKDERLTQHSIVCVLLLMCGMVEPLPWVMLIAVGIYLANKERDVRP